VLLCTQIVLVWVSGWVLLLPPSVLLYQCNWNTSLPLTWFVPPSARHTLSVMLVNQVGCSFSRNVGLACLIKFSVRLREPDCDLKPAASLLASQPELLRAPQ
jgi:hypothetical protein